MKIDHAYVKELSVRHPAWRLLRMDSAPLIISFLQKVYIEPNRRLLTVSEFTRLLDDDLYVLRQMESDAAFPRNAVGYAKSNTTVGVISN